MEKSLLENEDIQAVVITSPSYDGIVSDIAKIAQIVHRYGIPLIVDEAHGAHFAFHQDFPVSALELGADVVIHSLHKTLPAMTQTALLHKKGNLVSTEKLEEFLGIYETSSPSYILMGGISYCLRFLKEQSTEQFDKKGNLVSTEKLEEFLGIYETSSPSYILMGGISYCLRFLKEQSTEQFELFSMRVKNARKQLCAMKVLHLIDLDFKVQKDIFDMDLSKFVISTVNAPINGPQLHHILRTKYHLEMEDFKVQKDIFDMDLSKFVISTVNAPINGPQLHHILRTKYHLEMEMEAEQYVLALTSVMDSQEGFDRLVNALLETDESLWRKEQQIHKYVFEDSKRTAKNQQKCAIWQAMEGIWETVPLKESKGRVSTEYAYLYPPGIPLLVPGEIISEEFLIQAEHLKTQGMYLQGMKDYRQQSIRVLV